MRKGIKMSTDFDNPKTSKVHGTFGEFTIGNDVNTIRVKYVLSKIRPGNDGMWECILASEMKPWREVFKIEELSFDELLQRDLDDSRVAHELIPYLLGESGNKGKFFPPILAVIVPRKKIGSGIESFYPKLYINGAIEEYGSLFDFEIIKWKDKSTPFATMSYNKQKSAFIIVDGQHRAMAVLALHRQINENWGDNSYASYYDHIEVSTEEVKSIELPVCIMYFPDLHEGNHIPLEHGINLSSVCREIFLVVNRSAKIVSESRRLLLDDQDLAARLMRSTLSKLKNRKKDDELSRIYSISYGDSDTEIGDKEVISGRIEYSSAITLYKIHRALFFGSDEAFRIDDYADILDGRKLRNSNRPTEILLGTSVDRYPTISRNPGNTIPHDEVGKIIDKLGELADCVIVRLFDGFRPFALHNSELRRLRMKLLDPNFQSQVEQQKVYNLIFDGSGVRNVFESHFDRLKDEKDTYTDAGETVPHHLQRQIVFCESVMKALGFHEREFHRLRSCSFFHLNPDFFDNIDKHEDHLELSKKTRILFRNLSTQAFQLGYTMAIFSVVEELIRLQPSTPSIDYEKRLKLVKFVTEVYLTSLNQYFSPNKETLHRTLTGYFNEPRSSVFDANAYGLQGLLAMSVNELNERQWPFFRYAILEIVHSTYSWKAAQSKMTQMDSGWELDWYRSAIPRLAEGISSEREKYVNAAVEASVKGQEFELLKMRTESEEIGAGKSQEEIEQSIENLYTTRKEDAKKFTDIHLKASLQIIEKEEKMVSRLIDGL